MAKFLLWFLVALVVLSGLIIFLVRWFGGEAGQVVPDQSAGFDDRARTAMWQRLGNASSSLMVIDPATQEPSLTTEGAQLLERIKERVPVSLSPAELEAWRQSLSK